MNKEQNYSIGISTDYYNYKEIIKTIENNKLDIQHSLYDNSSIFVISTNEFKNVKRLIELIKDNKIKNIYKKYIKE